MFVKGPINKNKETAAQVSKGLNVFFIPLSITYRKKKNLIEKDSFSIFISHILLRFFEVH